MPNSLGKAEKHPPSASKVGVPTPGQQDDLTYGPGPSPGYLGLLVGGIAGR